MRGEARSGTVLPMPALREPVLEPAAARASGSLAALPWFRRFHVRAGLLFGVPVVLLLGVLSVVTHRLLLEREMDVLRASLDGLSVGLAHAIDPDDVEALRVPGDEQTEAYARLRAQLDTVARARPEVKSLYVFRRSDRPTHLSFVIDWVRTGRPGRVGELYDARQASRMRDGFAAPAIEPSTYDDAWGRNLSGYAPLRDRSGAVIAIVGVDLSARQVDEAERRALVITGTLVGLALVSFLLGGALLGRNIRRSLERIIDATEAIAAGASDVRTGLVRRDELGVLAARIDALARELGERDRLRAIFGRYVSEEVARKVLTQEGADQPRTREVTALFVDIRGYSTLSERLAPNEVIELLNTYFTAMFEVIDAHGGCVIELLGDAILAVFGAPEPLDGHAERAVRCALAVRERLAALNAEWEARGDARLWREHGMDRFAVRMGVHTDRVVAGSFGTDRRTKYAVLGRAVNLAVALEGLNKAVGTSVLVSRRVLAQLPGELAEHASDRGEHELRGERQLVHSL
jgi:adenylate cyclase